MPVEDAATTAAKGSAIYQTSMRIIEVERGIINEFCKTIKCARVLCCLVVEEKQVFPVSNRLQI